MSFLLALALEVVKAIPISLSVKIYVISLRIILYNNNNNKISTQNYVWNQQKETVKREKRLRKRTMVTMSLRSLGFRDWFWVQRKRKPYSRWFWGFKDPKWVYILEFRFLTLKFEGIWILPFNVSEFEFYFLNFRGILILLHKVWSV